MSEELCLCVCKNTTQRKHINCSNWETYTHTHAHKFPTCSDDGLTLPSVMRVMSSSGAQPTWLAVSPHQQSDMPQPHQVGEGCGSLVPTPLSLVPPWVGSGHETKDVVRGGRSERT